MRKKQKTKKGQKGIVSRELATTGIVYTVTEKKPMHEGVGLGLGLGVMKTAASEHGVRNVDRSGREKLKQKR